MIGGLTYNFLPFMVLPIYVSLEKIDLGLIDAASDLYSTGGSAFRKVVLPLSLPGVFAGSLLTFIPAAGRLHQRPVPRRTQQHDDRRGRPGPVPRPGRPTRRRRPSASSSWSSSRSAMLVYARVLGTDDLV